MLPDSLPCSDCGFDFPTAILKATLVGDLCPDCRQRFEDSARFLANMKTPTGIFREVKTIVSMYKNFTSIRSDRPRELL